jgi:hypothetical protein
LSACLGPFNASRETRAGITRHGWLAVTGKRVASASRLPIDHGEQGGSEMPAGQVNGVELYWEQMGAGPRLLFCNGSGTTLQAVRPLLDLVAARFDLLAWDYRGLGRSAPLRGPYTMADLAADAAGLLQIADWDACRVLGVSFGGIAELRGYEGGHLFLIQDPAALPEFQTFLQAPPV